VGGVLLGAGATVSKFQSHAVGEPVEVSVNCTVRGALPAVTFAEKPAVGGFGGPGGPER